VRAGAGCATLTRLPAGQARGLEAHALGTLFRGAGERPNSHLLDHSPFHRDIPDMSGIAENFQLNVLLMDLFPSSGWFAKRRVSAEAASIARGAGPQTSEEILTGAWNLYTWRAIAADGTLPAKPGFDLSANWIWNEGTPADIPTFESKRVILLGPPSYTRTWKSQRDFANLRADLKIERKLSANEVRDWLGRMAAANGPQG